MTPTKSDVLTQLTAAEEPSRVLDHRIHCALFGGDVCEYPPCVDGHGAPEYTRKLDAAVALVERMLPDAHYLMNVRSTRIRYAGDADFTVTDAVFVWRDKKEYSASKKTGLLALALCCALFRALTSPDQPG